MRSDNWQDNRFDIYHIFEEDSRNEDEFEDFDELFPRRIMAA